MIFFLPDLDQDGWCDCVLSTFTATVSSTVWLPPAPLQASTSFRRFMLPVLHAIFQVPGLQAFACLR